MDEFEIEIRTTGSEDVTSPWKVAIAGHPGSGKTLLASTAPKPLFVFFSEQPRLKSIARRYMPHVKLVNRPEYPAHEQLLEVVRRIRLGEIELETLVIDTGDELYQQMKEARRLQNGGEFGPGDWGWLADAYREVVEGLVDLPVRLIVLYHLKSASENDEPFRELMLQGASKDEAPGWFDVIVALDTFSVISEKGDEVTKRVLLSRSSRLYPWVKDHSGQMPTRFEISEDFVGDWKRLETLLNAELDDVEPGVFVGRFVVTDEEYAPEVEEQVPVPKPADLIERKRENATDPEGVSEPEPEAKAEVIQDPIAEPEPEPEVPEAEPSPEEAQANVEAELGPVEEVEEETLEEALEAMENGEPVELVAPPLAADGVEMVDEFEDEEEEEEEVKPAAPEKDECVVCGIKADLALVEVSNMRFRKTLCREHFMEERDKTARR